jgi:HSP20 family protein
MQHTTEPSDNPTDDLSASVGRIVAEIHSRSYYQYAPQRAWQPSINIYETEADYYISVELAGVKAGDIDMRTDKGVLVISGQRPDPLPRGEQAPLCVHLMEIDSGDFQREVRLPPSVAVDKIEAYYREGFLWIRLPKTNRPS